MLQHDEYGFIIGEKRLKELNGNVANIDTTTQEILEILTQSQKTKTTAGKRELSYLEQLILLSNEQNKRLLLIDSVNQNRENLSQNNPIATTSAINEYRLVAHRVLAIPRFSNASEYGAINQHQDNHQNSHKNLSQEGIRLTNNTPKPQQRDTNGRFVSVEQSYLSKAVDKLTTAVNMVNLDTKSISPEIDALHEIKDTISPVYRIFKGVGHSMGDLFGKKSKDIPLPKEQKKQNKKENLHQKEERRLLRLILRHIGDTSWLAWLLPLLGKIGFDGLGDREGRNRRGSSRGQGLFGGIFGDSKDNKKSPKFGKKGKFKLPAWLKLPDLTKLSRLPNKLPTWIKGAGLLGLVLSATELLDWQQMNVHERGGAVGGIAGGLAGGWVGGVAGASLGAAIGSVVPVIGTAAGGVIGGVIGALGGSWLGSDLGRMVGDKFAPHGASLINTVITHSKDISHKVSVITMAVGLAMRDNAVQTYRYLSDVVAKTWQVVQDGLDKVANFMTTLTAFARTALEMSLGVFGGMVSTAISSLDNLYQEAKQFVSSKMGDLSNYLSQKLSGIGGFLSEKLSSLTGFIASGNSVGSNVVGDDVGSYTINDGKVKLGKWSKHLKSNQFDKIAPMLAQKAIENDVDPETLLAFANIESSFDPTAQNTNYGGVFQISKKHHKNWRNPEYNTDVALKMMKDNKRYYHRHFGKNAKWTAGLAYLYHQQGMGGATELLKNPNMSAAAALQRTREYRNKSLDWIWKHVVQANGGRVGMSAKEFSDLWVKRADVLEDAYRKQGKYSRSKSNQNKSEVGVGVKTSNTSYAQSKTQNDTLDKVIQNAKPQVGVGVKVANFVSVQPLVAEPSDLAWTTVANTVLSTFGVQTNKVFFKPTPVIPKNTPVPTMSNIITNTTQSTERTTTVFMPQLSQQISDDHLARLLSGGYASS